MLKFYRFEQARGRGMFHSLGAGVAMRHGRRCECACNPYEMPPPGRRGTRELHTHELKWRFAFVSLDAALHWVSPCAWRVMERRRSVRCYVYTAPEDQVSKLDEYQLIYHPNAAQRIGRVLCPEAA